MADKEVEIKLSQVSVALLMEVQMEERMIKDLNKYLDARHNKPEGEDFSSQLVGQEGEDFSSQLVGQISHGEQLKIDTKDPLIVPFVKYVAQLATTYVQHFGRHVGIAEMKLIPHVHSFLVDTLVLLR